MRRAWIGVSDLNLEQFQEPLGAIAGQMRWFPNALFVGAYMTVSGLVRLL